MAFEKMTDEELYGKFLFCITDELCAPEEFKIKKIGARALKLETTTGGHKPLYFIWYNDHNWTLGTKLYRKRPKRYRQKELDPVYTVTSAFALVPTHDGSGDVRIACATSQYADDLVFYIQRIIATFGAVSLEAIKEHLGMKTYYTDTKYIWDEPSDFKQEIENGVEYVRFHLHSNTH